jgi:hypothetical protein
VRTVDVPLKLLEQLTDAAGIDACAIRVDRRRRRATFDLHSECWRELYRRSRDKTTIGAGDLVARATSAIGLPPCASCTKRQQWLNDKVRIWRPRRDQSLG